MNEDLALWFESEILVHGRGLTAFISRFTQPRDAGGSEVLDILQEVYVKIWADAASMRDNCRSPKAYVYEVARNLLIDLLRRRNVLPIECYEDPELLNLLVDHITPERAASDREELEQLTECFDKLPDRRREAVWLRRVEGRSQKDAAIRMGITEGTLEQTFSRAMIQLADCFGSGYPEAEDSAPHEILALGKSYEK
jgi:RNA polymerase sigma-70 factor (ECF subfamily)